MPVEDDDIVVEMREGPHLSRILWFIVKILLQIALLVALGMVGYRLYGKMTSHQALRREVLACQSALAEKKKALDADEQALIDMEGEMDVKKAEGDVDAYNALVRVHNRKLDALNAAIDDYNEENEACAALVRGYNNAPIVGTGSTPRQSVQKYLR